MKTNKAYKKRIKVTKNKKLVARKPGHCHFNAKESGTERQSKKRTQIVSMTNKTASRFLANLE